MANETKQTKKRSNYSERYAIIQVSRETHNMLKEYCDTNGFKIGAIVGNVMRKFIKGQIK